MQLLIFIRRGLVLVQYEYLHGFELTCERGLLVLQKHEIGNGIRNAARASVYLLPIGVAFTYVIAFCELKS